MDQHERRHIVADQYIAALSSPNEETLAALASVLADDVDAAGMFGSGHGRDAVIASTGAPPYPFLASAGWGAPETDGDVTSVRGSFPPGLPVVSVTVTMRFAGEILVELTQELEQARPAAPTALVIDDQLAAIIDGAFDTRTPFVVAYVDAAACRTCHRVARSSRGAWTRSRCGRGILPVGSCGRSGPTPTSRSSTGIRRPGRVRDQRSGAGDR